MRKVIAIAILMLFPGCLDTAPETLEGVEILAPDEIVEGDSAEIRAHGKSQAELNICGTLETI